MNDAERAKIEKLLGLLEDQRIGLERAKHILAELDKELRVRLNDDFSVKTQV